MLVAATGVGAGDLITASLAGSIVGVSILWAAVVGAFLKWVLNEGIARWQMATSSTVLEGWISHLGAWVRWMFFAYFLLWSYSVGGALINGCGVAGAGLLPLGDPHTSKIVWGAVHSLVGLAIVWAGGFRVFERIMSFLTALMVVTVLLTVVLLSPDWSSVAKGLLTPGVPRGGAGWLLAVMGGVGGTVTLLCYSYWIREKGRSGQAGMKECRLDLGVAYVLTAFFGAAMVIIGSRIKVEGRGDTVALALADQLGLALGPFGRYLFLLGFWGAVFTSLLGVWQGVPYLLADFLNLRRRRVHGRPEPADLKKTVSYRLYLLALAVLPISLLWFKVQQVQFVYGVMGALFMPFMALTLLLLNNRVRLVGRDFRNGWLINVFLILTLALFCTIGFGEILDLLN